MWTYEECIHLFCTIPEYSAVDTLRLSSLRVEYSTVDTLGWAHGQLSIELWTLRWAHEELSIQLWTLSGGLIESWVFNCEHSLVSSWTAEYSTANTLGWAHGQLSNWAADTLRWAHWKLNIHLWTLSGELMDSYGHSLVGSLRVGYSTMDTHWHLSIQLWTVSSELYSELSIQLFTPYDQMDSLVFTRTLYPLTNCNIPSLTPDNLRWAINSGYYTLLPNATFSNCALLS